MWLQINKDHTLQFLLLKVRVTIWVLYASTVAVCMEHSGVCDRFTEVGQIHVKKDKVIIDQIKQTLHRFKVRTMSNIKELSLGKPGD